MNDDHLDRLLDQLRDEPIPDAPENLESRVLRMIRTSKADDLFGEGWWSISLASAIRLAAVVAFLAIGTGLVVGSAIAQTSIPGERLAVRQALSFDVFHADSVGLQNNLPAE